MTSAGAVRQRAERFLRRACGTIAPHRAPLAAKALVDSTLSALNIEHWKPLLTALLLPPVPLLVLLLIGVRLILPRRGWGWFVVLLSVAGLWLSACTGSAEWLTKLALHPPAALAPDRIKALRAEARAVSNPATAIIVLGGGMEPYAPEYGVANLRHPSLERLRYGVWLGRETGLPVGFSGGVGWAQREGGMAEARVASQIASAEFGRPLKWVEDNSRDTRENARRTIAMLKATNVRHIVLVTHGYHMPRSVREFEAAGGSAFRVEAAPMGLAQRLELPVLEWVPTSSGFEQVRQTLRELLARAAGY